MASEKVTAMIEEIKAMSVLELSELVHEIEDVFGVSAAAAVAAAPVAGAAAAAEEKTEFDVVLTGFGDQKIKVIKAVREITNLGLAEAKAKVEGITCAIKEPPCHPARRFFIPLRQSTHSAPQKRSPPSGGLPDGGFDIAALRR